MPKQLWYRISVDAIKDFLLSEFGEKIVVLRHDVDNTLDIYRAGRLSHFSKVVNVVYQLGGSYASSLVEILPLYEHFIYDLLDFESEHGATSTFFFRISTIPTRKLYRKIISKGYEVGYHSDRNANFCTWFHDLRRIEMHLKTKLLGYTKHGYSRFRGGGEWDEAKFIAYASLAGLKYLAQGVGHPSWELPKKVKGVWVWGHHITLKKASAKAVKEYVEGKELPLILVHPEDFHIPGERLKLEHVLSRRRGVSVIEVVNTLEKILREKGVAI